MGWRRKGACTHSVRSNFYFVRLSQSPFLRKFDDTCGELFDDRPLSSRAGTFLLANQSRPACAHLSVDQLHK